MSTHERELLAKYIAAHTAAVQVKRATIEIYTDAAEEAAEPKEKPTIAHSGY